jgi:hypothetical protein
VNARVRRPGAEPDHGPEGVAGDGDRRPGVAAQEVGDRGFDVFLLVFPAPVFPAAASDATEVKPQGRHPGLSERGGQG